MLGTDEPMCRNLEAVEAALKIGAEVEKAACKHKEAHCPFYETCHYQAQKAPASKADVVFAAHEILFQVPKALGKNSAWSSSTRRSGRTASPASPASPSPGWRMN